MTRRLRALFAAAWRCAAVRGLRGRARSDGAATRFGGVDDWARLPTPSLVVEVLSGTTRRRDLPEKRALYLDAGVRAYWVIDGRDVRVVTLRFGGSDRGAPDAVGSVRRSEHDRGKRVAFAGVFRLDKKDVLDFISTYLE